MCVILGNRTIKQKLGSAQTSAAAKTLSPSEHNKIELLKEMTESVERNVDFHSLFGAKLQEMFKAAKKNKGDFKVQVLKELEQLPDVYELLDIDGMSRPIPILAPCGPRATEDIGRLNMPGASAGDGGDAVDMMFAKNQKDLKALEKGTCSPFYCSGCPSFI